MPEEATKDQQIIEAADQLFYQQGFDYTSFQDIARAVKISRGNFYYHFKTKDDILAAVIERRKANTRAMLAQWENQAENPAQCICSYIRILSTNLDQIEAFGCPVGTLCSELAKLDHSQVDAAKEIFGLFRRWLAGHFASIGQPEKADQRALQVLAWSQGVATLVNAYKDRDFVRAEVERMCAWVSSLGPAN